MQDIPKIGRLIEEGDNARRDAVHVAVAPVTAGEDLLPGQHVSHANGVAHSSGDWIGIVDPYLTEIVREGQRFYLFLYPGTVTSLRHVWAHPAFKPRLPVSPTSTPGDSPEEKESS